MRTRPAFQRLLLFTCHVCLLTAVTTDNGKVKPGLLTEVFMIWLNVLLCDWGDKHQSARKIVIFGDSYIHRFIFWYMYIVIQIMDLWTNQEEFLEKIWRRIWLERNTVYPWNINHFKYVWRVSAHNNRYIIEKGIYLWQNKKN